MRKLVDSLKTRATLTAWLEKHATVTLECEPEHERIEGNASAIDPATDAETNAWIHDQLRCGNEWAWCVAKVTVRYEGYSATDYLGCCSYESEAAFKEGPYYADMVHACCVDLVAQLMAARETLQRVWDLASTLPDTYPNDSQREPSDGVK